jgi:hypothetical protein
VAEALTGQLGLDPALVGQALVQLACGRIDPQEQIDAGRVRWTGGDEFGSRAVRNLRYTM